MDLDVGCLVQIAVGGYANVLFAYIIVTFLQSMAGLRIPDVMRPAVNFVYDICEPFLRVFRGLLPSVNLGGMGLDLSPIIGFIVLRIAAAILREILGGC